MTDPIQSTTKGARPVVIGLAGGIGSGKSTVARAFAALGCVVSDSDAQAREALGRPEVITELVGWWGTGVLGAEGAIDRRAVARIVFQRPRDRARLEGLIHPLIRRSREQLLAEAAGAGAPAVIVDAPLLFEAGLDAECDAVVFVDAPRAARLARVSGRGWDAGELDRRENAQMPLDDKRARADYVVVNDGPAEDLGPRAEAILRAVLDKANRQAEPPGGSSQAT